MTDFRRYREGRWADVCFSDFFRAHFLLEFAAWNQLDRP
jgi:hypothetical protein